jgi:glycerophosphoryl diester phosphodiesterase
VTLFFTAASPDAVRHIQADDALLPRIGGLSIFHELVTADLVDWAYTHDLLVIAWTVHEAADVQRLIAAGIDGITTPNLAIIEALTHQG